MVPYPQALLLGQVADDIAEAHMDGGKAVRLSGGDRVEIGCSQRVTQLVRLADRSFYQIINQKLGGLSQ